LTFDEFDIFFDLQNYDDAKLIVNVCDDIIHDSILCVKNLPSNIALDLITNFTFNEQPVAVHEK